MFNKKFDKIKSESKTREDEFEMEDQFILRLPEPAADLLNKSIHEGNCKDRFLIKLEGNMRHGEVYLDQYHYYGKIVDLPTIIESMKTIDNKNFYKTADISQIMVCKEQPDEDTDKEPTHKGKKKDSNKVEKKYLHPHGLTPPCKNVRKRRFRKTLKKKTVDIPEIEKEVKRLLKQDSEAVRVEYEVINEELDKFDGKSELKDINEQDEDDLKSVTEDNKNSCDATSQLNTNVDSDDEGQSTSFAANNNLTCGSIGEHDIFGGALTSSDEDDDDQPKANQRQLMAQLSEEESRFSGFYDHNAHAQNAGGDKKNTEFNASMFSGGSGRGAYHESEPLTTTITENIEGVATSFYDNETVGISFEKKLQDKLQLSNEEIQAKILSLRTKINELKLKQVQKTQEISTLQNATLKQRIQETLDSLESQIIEKELEINEFSDML